ncbi:MAG: mannose-6-phosphate isomerase, class I [Brooklawnia sp.]|jgi:mannose-6-phosphate isomerase
MQPLTGAIKRYDWGSTEVIPQMLGMQPDGLPLAEYWLGAHPAGPASIDGVRLDELIANDPAMLGDSARTEFGGRLPFMMKVLSAARPLSLQAHPDRLNAEAGYARENELDIAFDAAQRTFKDPWDKPELMVALSDFDALAGFRDPLRSADLFMRLGLPAKTQLIFAPLQHREGPAALAEVFLDCLVLDEDRRDAVTDVVSAAVRHINDGGELGDFARTAVRLDEHFPGDPSVLAALLLNRHHLRPGDALHMRPGTLHAYLSGTCIEVMGSSDNVLRGGLTRKHIDPSALVQVVDFSANPMRPLPPELELPGLWFYPTGERAFALWRIELMPGRLIELPAQESSRIVLCTDGEIGLSTGQDSLICEVGRAAYLRPGEDVCISGQGQAFLAATGADA